MTSRPRTLEELIELAENSTRRYLLDEGRKEMAPQWHLISPDGKRDTIVITPWDGDIQKQLAVAQVRDLSHRMGAVAVCFSTECWMLDTSRANIPNTEWHRDRYLRAQGRPSRSPDRIEAVIFVAHDHSRTICKTLQMVRDKPGGRLISLIDYAVPQEGSYESWMLDGMILPSAHNESSD